MPDDASSTEGGDPAPAVVTFGTFDVDRHPRIHILEEGLAANGYAVLRCNVPWDAPTDERVAALRRPWIGAKLACRLLVAWWRLVRRSWRRRHADVDAVVVGYLGLFDIHLARLLWRRRPLVLDHLAPAAGIVDDRLGKPGVRGRLAATIDGAATRRAELIVVDTDEHVVPADADRTVVVPVGATRAWFDARRASDEATAPLSIVFFGLFTPLHGAPVLGEALRLLYDDGVPFAATLVGHGQDLNEVRGLLGGMSSVRWHRWVDSDHLPQLVAAHDVCLGIFGTTPKARRVVPNKVFQGAAAGCAVVTSDTPPQRRSLGPAGLLVPPGEPEPLAAVLAQLAGDPAQVRALRRAAASRADAAFTPQAVVEPLVARMRSLVEPS